MADSVQAAPPVNATVTIQPVATTPSNQDGANPSQNPLANLANGTTVEGFVVNRDAQNNPILRTAIGDVQVTSDIFLKTGSEVTIKIDNTVPSLAKILSVDGLTPQDYNAQSARGLTQDTISTSAVQPLLNIGTAQPAGNSTLPAGAPILQAIILQPQELPLQPLLTAALANAQSGPAQVLAQLSQLSAGTPIRLALLDIKLPPVPISLSSLPESNSLDSFLPPKPPAGELQQTIRQTEGQPQVGAYKPAATQSTPSAQSTPSTQQTVPAQEMDVAELFAAVPKETAPLQTGIQLQQQVPTAQLETQSSDNNLLVQPPLVQPTIVFDQAAIHAAPTQVLTPVTTPAPTATTPTATTPTNTQPATSPQPQLNQPTAPNQLVANVIGHDADGANILQTPFASLKVYTPQPLPTGTTLLLQADLQPTQATQSVPGASIAASTAPIAPLQSIAQHLSGELSAFSDALGWLVANQPDLAQAVQARLPTISNNLASTMLFYIAGIKSGDVADIIGKRATRQLELNAPDILSRLRQSVGDMQANFLDSPLPHWTVIPMPFWFGQELQQLQMYIGKEPPENSQNPNQQNRGQRFVLEVGLSHIGDMQFDGFVHQRTLTKSFDLMVRTAAALPDDVTQGIRSIFENSMQVTGMRGQVIFQHGRQHFVKPLAEAPATRFEGGANTILA